jgi:hypothetical protein
MLTRFQRMMLRGWARNMVVAFRIPGWQAKGFDYTHAEQARLRAIAADLSGAAFAVWFLLTAAMFFAAMMPLLWLLLTRLPQPASMLALPAIILGGLVVLPLALGLASGVTDWMFRLSPFLEAADDGEFYAKLRSQLIMVAAIAIAAAALIGWWIG